MIVTGKWTRARTIALCSVLSVSGALLLVLVKMNYPLWVQIVLAGVFCVAHLISIGVLLRMFIKEEP